MCHSCDAIPMPQALFPIPEVHGAILAQALANAIEVIVSPLPDIFFVRLIIMQRIEVHAIPDSVQGIQQRVA